MLCSHLLLQCVHTAHATTNTMRGNTKQQRSLTKPVQKQALTSKDADPSLSGWMTLAHFKYAFFSSFAESSERTTASKSVRWGTVCRDVKRSVRMRLYEGGGRPLRGRVAPTLFPCQPALEYQVSIASLIALDTEEVASASWRKT